MTSVNVDAELLAMTKSAREALTGVTYTHDEVAKAAFEFAALMWGHESAQKTETERHDASVQDYKRAKQGELITRPPANPAPEPESKDPPEPEDPGR